MTPRESERARLSSRRLNKLFKQVARTVRRPSKCDLRRWMVVWMLGYASCSTEETLSVVVSADPEAGVNWLVVRSFDGYGPVGERSLAVGAVPVVVALPDPRDEPGLRVVAVGRGARPSRAGARMDGSLPPTLQLTVAFADADGDGVIDELDDCPTVADWDQRNARGSGPGDACVGSGVGGGGGGGGGAGGSAADLGSRTVSAGSDLSLPPEPSDGGVVMLVRDLGRSPDLTAHPADLAPPPSCNPSAATLCEGFENGLNAWTIVADTGTVTLDATHVHRGALALKVHTSALVSGDYAEAAVSTTAGFPTSSLYARAWIYVPSGFDPGPASLMRVAQSSSPYSTADFQLEGSGLSTWSDLTGSQIYHGIAGVIAHDTWSCVEWQVLLSATGAMNVWLDGTAVAPLSLPEDLSSSPPPGEIEIGIAAQAISTDIGARDLWIDDVAIAGARVGCQ
jgi:hypothetical protein